ncbi:MAG: hypothetical protein AAGA55_04010, partial [Planctomycetota bacterium]
LHVSCRLTQADTTMPIHSSNKPAGLPHDIGRSGPLLHRISAVIASFSLLFLSAAAAIAFLPNAGRGAWDATVYHEPLIRALAGAWPRFDLRDPLSATTPGYHILLASLDVIGFDSSTSLRLASALIGATLIALLSAWCARRVRPLDAFLLALPIAASIYTFQSSAFVLPDNLAWIGVLVILACCLRDPPGWKPIVAASVVLPALVFTRQVHLWAAAPIWLAAWLGVRQNTPFLFASPASRIPRTATAMAMTVPGFLVVGWFIQHWGGAVPPRFQSDMSGGNPATPAFILLQCAILAVGFGPWVLPGVLLLIRDHGRIALLALAVGLLLAVTPDTTFDRDAGRYSGWWALARITPDIGGRSNTAVVLFAPLGALIVAGSLAASTHRARWTLLGTLVAFAAAQSATAYAWQRYHEPFLIMFFALAAASQPSHLRRTLFVKVRVPAMLAFCAVLAWISLTAIDGDPVEPGTNPPPMHTQPTDPWFEPSPGPTTS